MIVWVFFFCSHVALPDLGASALSSRVCWSQTTALLQRLCGGEGCSDLHPGVRGQDVYYDRRQAGDGNRTTERAEGDLLTT